MDWKLIFLAIALIPFVLYWMFPLIGMFFKGVCRAIVSVGFDQTKITHEIRYHRFGTHTMNDWERKTGDQIYGEILDLDRRIKLIEESRQLELTPQANVTQ